MRFVLIHFACSWIGSGILYALILSPFIMGPYRWARFRYFNLTRKLFIWIARSWRFFLIWPLELPRFNAVLSDDNKFCYEEDILYKIPACRLIGYLDDDGAVVECFYQIGDRCIRGSGKRFFFCNREEIVAEMMVNAHWVTYGPSKDYIHPRRLADCLTITYARNDFRKEYR